MIDADAKLFEACEPLVRSSMFSPIDVLIAEAKCNAVARNNQTLAFQETGAPTSGEISRGSNEEHTVPRSTREDGNAVRDPFKLLQKWEGVVISVEKNTFWARLTDLTAEGPEEEAEFPVEELPSSELEWLVPGSVFYWTLGYRNPNGQRKRESAIRFRRVPQVTAEDARRAQEEASNIAREFGWT